MLLLQTMFLHGQELVPPANAEGAVQWLRSLVIEERLKVEMEGQPFTSRLFTKSLTDRRSWADFLEDSIGASGNWAYMDEAVRLLLQQADYLAGKVFETANDSEKNQWRQLRKTYLEMAARMLQRYAQIVGTDFDVQSSSLQSSSLLPDILLPGEIHLHRIAGSGKIHTGTFDFQGRLSGEVALPGLDTQLSVPNLSFDSKGNFDFTAYGATAMPPGDPNQVQLLIPPRRPLGLHVGDDGDFSIGGGLRLKFPDGSQVESFFDVDDPKYRFGIAFSGRATLELAKQLSVSLPTIDINAASFGTMESISGLGQVLGGFSRGVESVLTQASELPSPSDIEIGQPPEFSPPETVVPVDIVEAWAIGLANASVRNAMNLSIEQKNKFSEHIREVIDQLKASLISLQAEQAATLTVAKKMNRLNDLNGDISKLLEDEATRQLLGEESSTSFTEQLTEASAQSVSITKLLMENAEDFKTGLASAGAYMESVANNHALGGEVALEQDVIINKIDYWADAFLLDYGVNFKGVILDQNKVNRWDEDACLILMHFGMYLDGEKASLGDEEHSIGFIDTVVSQLFKISKDRYVKSIADQDLEGRVISAAFLSHCAKWYDLIGGPSDEQIDLMQSAWFETFESLTQRGGGGQAGRKLAGSFAEAANRHLDVRLKIAHARVDEIMGRDTEAKASSASPNQLSVPYNLFDEASTIWSTFQSIFSEGNPNQQIDAKKSVMRDYAQTIIDDSNEMASDAAELESNLKGGLARLKFMLDALAFLDEHMPEETELIDRFTTSWQALHVQWTAITEVQKYHWMLENYIGAIVEASQRYGDGVSQALQNAMLESGRQTLQGMVRIGEGLGIQLEAIGSNDFDMLLPGDLELRSIYGEVEFDRSNFDWGLKLGGRLEFPDIQASFDVPLATVNNRGEFVLSLNARTDRVFGLSNDYSLSLQVPSAGGPSFQGRLPFVEGLQPDGSPIFAAAALSSFSGQGSLIQRSDKTSYAASVAYESDFDGDGNGPDGHRFKIEAAFEGQQELFTPEIMLFSGGIGFELETQLDGNPTQVGTEVASSAGVWLRPESAAKAPEERTEDDYYLNFTGRAKLDYSIEEGFLELSLMSGQLMLPKNVFSGSNDTRPLITLQEPICIRIDPDNPEKPIFWCDDDGSAASLQFTHIGFKVPGTEFIYGELTSATLNFDQSLLPSISNANGYLRLELSSGPIELDLLNASLSLNGYPQGTIALGNNVTLFEASGFGLDLLGGESCGSAEGSVSSGLTVYETDEGSLPRVRLDGGMRFLMPPDVLLLEEAEEGSQTTELEGQLSFVSCGSLELTPSENGFPIAQIEFEKISFAAKSMRLGGTEGFRIRDVELSVAGIQGFFDNFAQGPAVIKFSGGLEIDQGPAFALRDARISMDQSLVPTFFAPSEMSISNDSDNKLELFEGFSVNILKASIGFKTRELPLPALVSPENIILSTSAELGINAEVVQLSGRVDDLSIELEDGVTKINLDGLGIGIDALDIPPIGLQGQVYVRGLQNPGENFENVYFSGILGGKMYNAGVSASVALTTQKLLGICLDVNAGPAGIPLGQTTLLFTGASGGVLFDSINRDPCEFLSDFPAVDGPSIPANQPRHVRPKASLDQYGVTWDELGVRLAEQMRRDAVGEAYQEAMRPHLAKVSSRESAGLMPRAVSTTPEEDTAGLNIPCPNADCPPPSVNILCQPHPNQELFPDKIIVKFTSLDRPQATQILDALNFTPLALEQLGVVNAEMIAGTISDYVRNIMEELFPIALPELVGDELAQALNEERANVIEGIAEGLRFSFEDAIVSTLNGESDIYEAILQAAYAGLDCPDVAVSLKGVFSQVAVSSFLSVEGGGVLSTSGSVGLVGKLNVIGMPIGNFNGFASGTDSQGDPNPSLCGSLDMGVGPLSAQVRMAYTCEECVTGFLEAFGGLIGCLLNESGAAIEASVQAALAKVAPEHAQLSAATLDAELTVDQKVALFGELFSNPPEDLEFSDCFVTSLVALTEAINPILRTCGDSPRLFGIPLGGNDFQFEANKRGFAGSLSAPPSNLLAGLITGGATNALLPPLDRITVSIASEAFNAEELFISGLTGNLASPEQFAGFIADGFERSITRTVFGIQHKFNPMGLTLADNQARLVMPNLIRHPADPNTGWSGVPEGRGLPSRSDVLLAAMQSEFLANALWRGDKEDLFKIFPEGSSERQAVAGRSFGTDYFPHGGIVAAGRMGIPSMIADAPPAELGVIFGEGDLFEKLEATLTLINDYILNVTEVGEVAMYIPAPNPPILTDQNGDSLSQQELMQAILAVDPTQIALAPFYPAELSFLRGVIRGQLMGVPLLEASLIAEPPNPETGEEGSLTATTSVPENAWLEPFLGSAEMQVRFSQAPPQSIEDFFTNLRDVIQAAIDAGQSPQELADLLESIQAGILSGLPRVSVTASLDRLRIPEPFSEWMVPGQASASFAAYSPYFNPEPRSDDPLRFVKQKGGIAIEASAQFAGFLNMPEMILSMTPPGITELPSLSAAGRIEAFRFPPNSDLALFDMQSLTNDPLIGASVDFASNGEISIALSPVSVSSPFLFPTGPMKIYGASELEAFTIHSSEEWTATLELDGMIELKLPDGTPALRLGDPGDRHIASVEGVGFGETTVRLSFDQSLQVTAFPGNEQLEQNIVLSPAVDGRLELLVRSNGDFQLKGEVGADFSPPLGNLPVTGLQAGATVEISNTGLVVTGEFSGGALNLVGVPVVSGRLAIGLNEGIQFEADASIPPTSLPLRYGVFEVNAIESGDGIPMTLTSSGFLIGGARLGMSGLSADLITLDNLELQANGDFSGGAQNGAFAIPNFFSVSSGGIFFAKEGSSVSLSFAAPSIVLLPNSPMQTLLEAPVERLLVESDGRMYVDSGQRTIPLPGLAEATGRIEFGYEPDGAMPLPELNARVVDFGQVGVGSNAVKTVRVTNRGGATLVGSSIIEEGLGSFQVTPSLYVLEPGEAIDLEIYYFPQKSERVNGVLNLPSTRFDDLKVALTGQGLSRPQFHVSETDTMDFGEQAVGGGLNRQLHISNLGTATLRIAETQLQGPWTVSPSSFEVEPGKTQRLFLSFRPKAQENYTSTLTWQTNEPEKVRSLKLEGTGTQFRWYEQRAGGPIIRDLFMINGKEGWAVGDNGTLLKTTTGGRAWSAYKSPTGRNLNAVVFNSDGSNGWIAGDAGTVFETEDGGLSWQVVTDTDVQDPALSWKDAAVYGSRERLILVGEDSRDGRAALTYQNSNTSFRQFNVSGLQGLYGVSAHSKWICAVGSNGLLVYSFNGGISWNESLITGANALRFNDVSIDENGSAVAVSGGGMVYHSNLVGANWTRINDTGTFQNLYATERIGEEVWVSGESGVLIHSTDGGLSWTSETVNKGTSLFAVATRDGQVWASGRRGEIHHRPQALPTTPRLLMSSDRLDFGVSLPGRVSSQSITLQNAGPNNMTFNASKLTGDAEFSVQGADLEMLAPGQTARIRVLFSPAEPGIKTGSIVLQPVGDLVSSFEITLQGESAGSSWSVTGSPSEEHILDIQFLDERLGFAIDKDEVYRTENGGDTWTALNANPPGILKGINFLNALTGFAYGGNVRNSSNFIRTTDGGKTWRTLNTGVSHPITDVVAPIKGNSRILFAMTASYMNGFNRVFAVILKSTNGGDSWQTIGRPSQVFLGGQAIHVQPNLSTLFVAGGNILYRSTDEGKSWTEVLRFSGSQLIYDIEFLDENRGWLVGESGLFRRTETGGAASSDWLRATSLSAGTLRQIRFTDSNNGWIAGEGSFLNNQEPALFRSIDGGRTWSNTLVDGDFTVRTVSPISEDTAFAGGTNGRFVKYAPAPTVSYGLVTATEVVHFGEVESGQTANATIKYENVGNKTVKLFGLQFDVEQSLGLFRYEGSVPLTLDPGRSFTVDIYFRSTSTGGFNDALGLLNDGVSSIVTTDLSAVVPASEGVLILDTFPPGLTIMINGLERTAPVTLTIRPDANEEQDVVSPGEQLLVEAPELVTKGSVNNRFVGWKPFQERQFVLEVPLVSKRLVAHYEGVLSSKNNVISPIIADVPNAPQPRAVLAPVLIPALLTSVDPPPGPWVRISGVGPGEAATISHPLLGQFPVNVSAYLSSKEFEMSLGSRSLQIPDGAAQGEEWISVNPGSLDLSYREGAWFRMQAASGSVTVLGVQSPGAGHVSFELMPALRAEVTLGSDTPILPHIFEFGAGSSLSFDTNGEPSMEFAGKLRMLRTSSGNWFYDKNLQFDTGLQDFEIVLGDLVADTPIFSNDFVSLLIGSDSPRLFFRKGSNGYEGGISNLKLDLFQESLRVAETVAGSDGTFALDIDPLEIDLNSLMTLRTDNSSHFEWNILNGNFALQLSSGDFAINDSNAWPVSGIPLPGFTITSADFQHTFEFSPFEFAELPLSGLDQGESYWRLTGANGELGFSARGEIILPPPPLDENPLANASFVVEINATSGAGLTARASGAVSIFPINYDADLVYDSDNADWPFSGTAVFGPNEICVRVGPGFPFVESCP